METFRLRQRSTNTQPMRRKVISLKHVQLRLDTSAAKHTATYNHYEDSCKALFYFKNLTQSDKYKGS